MDFIPALQRLGAGSEDSNLSTSNLNASDSGSPATRPGSVELIHSSQHSTMEEKDTSPEEEPKSKKKSRFDQEPDEQSSQKENKEEKKLGKKNDWDMFAEADNFAALNVSFLISLYEISLFSHMIIQCCLSRAQVH